MTNEQLETGKNLKDILSQLNNIEQDIIIESEKIFNNYFDNSDVSTKELARIIEEEIKIAIKTKINLMQQELEEQFNEL